MSLIVTFALFMVKGSYFIWNSLHICLWDNTQKWYVVRLSNLQQNNLHRDLSLNNWIKTLMVHFKQSEQATLDILLLLHYTLNNIQNNHSITAYVQTMIQNENNAGLLTSNQLLLTWNKLHSELQCDILKSKANMIVVSFIEQLEKNM